LSHRFSFLFFRFYFLPACGSGMLSPLHALILDANALVILMSRGLEQHHFGVMFQPACRDREIGGALGAVTNIVFLSNAMASRAPWTISWLAPAMIRVSISCLVSAISASAIWRAARESGIV
jgi:hypothetical protein